MVEPWWCGRRDGRCAGAPSARGASDELKDAHLCRIAAAGAGAENAGVAAAFAELGGAGVILGGVFLEHLLDEGMMHVLDARDVCRFALLLDAHFLQISELRHEPSARGEFLRAVVDELDVRLFALGIGPGLGDRDFVLISTDGEGDELFGYSPDFLGAVDGGLDLAVPQEFGNLISEHRHSLIGAFT